MPQIEAGRSWRRFANRGATTSKPQFSIGTRLLKASGLPGLSPLPQIHLFISLNASSPSRFRFRNRNHVASFGTGTGTRGQAPSRNRNWSLQSEPKLAGSKPNPTRLHPYLCTSTFVIQSLLLVSFPT